MESLNDRYKINEKIDKIELKHGESIDVDGGVFIAGSAQADYGRGELSRSKSTYTLESKDFEIEFDEKDSTITNTGMGRTVLKIVMD